MRIGESANNTHKMQIPNRIQRRKNLMQAGIAIDDTGRSNNSGLVGEQKASDESKKDNEEDDDEFPMMPATKPSSENTTGGANEETSVDAGRAKASASNEDEKSTSPHVTPFANDGSFLALAKEKLAAEAAKE